MRRDRIKKFLSIVVLIAVLFIVNIDNIFGAINTDYYNTIKESMGVDNTYVDQAAESSVLLDVIGILVYAVGSILEKILGYIFEFMTGDNGFPWADAILFNAIPMLDINIFNPSQASIIATLQNVISNTYWTVFTLALSFFGIAVMVTAIKLAVSTIASDKALYKQAIVRWLMGFVMLCGIHFFMSFAIYLNEQLVIEAQNIASDAIGDTVVDIEKLRDTGEQDYAIVENFLTTMLDTDNFSWAIFAAAAVVVVVGIKIASYFVSGGTLLLADLIIAGAGLSIGYVAADLSPDVAIALTSARYNLDNAIISTYENSDQKEEMVNIITKNYAVSAELLSNTNYVKTLENRVKLKLRGDSEGGIQDVFIDPGDSSWKPVALVAHDVATIVAKGSGNDITVEIDGKQVSYIDFLEYYVINVDSLLDIEKITKKYDSNDLNKYQISYNVLDGVDDSGNVIIKKAYCTSSGSTACKDAMDFITLVKDNGQVVTVTGHPNDYVNYDTAYYEHAKMMVDIYEKFDPSTGKMTTSGTKNTNVISALANTFKNMAWENTETSWKPSRVNLEGALLYAILVAQSLIFFISYAKRLFYIIILIVMAPVVVVYDFFTKFSS